MGGRIGDFGLCDRQGLGADPSNFVVVPVRESSVESAVHTLHASGDGQSRVVRGPAAAWSREAVASGYRLRSPTNSAEGNRPHGEDLVTFARSSTRERRLRDVAMGGEEVDRAVAIGSDLVLALFA